MVFPEEPQWGIVEVHLNPQHSVENARRPWVEDLNDCKPKENGQRQKEGDLEHFHLMPALGRVKREIRNSIQEVLGKIDRHAVAEILPRQIFEHEPDHKKDN